MSLHQGPDAALTKTSYDDSTPDTLPSEEKANPNSTPAVTPADAPPDDFPDGGLQAWLVVFGVSTFAVVIDPRHCQPLYYQFQAMCNTFST
jgi:hypothetical protein